MSGVGKVDISKIKPGDKVSLIPLEVLSVEGDRIYLRDERSFLWMDTDQIAAHYPAPREFQVGDRVQLKMGSIPGTVRGVDRDEVWVEWDKDLYSPIRLAAHLTLVEARQ